MDRMIANCGLVCSECPAYQSTISNDDNLRVETAKLWSSMYKSEIKPEMINCEGCNSTEGVIFSHCLVCDIRGCATERGLENCGHCTDFPCEKLDMIHQAIPDAKELLKKIHNCLDF